MGLFKLFEIKGCRRFSAASFFYLCCFILCGTSRVMDAQSTSEAKKIYKITDARNPDCPCHKYQKTAEKEFKKIVATGYACLHMKSNRFSRLKITSESKSRAAKKKMKAPFKVKKLQTVFKQFLVKVTKKFQIRNKIVSCPKW